ncbi:hypothetical protein SERLA73DRAFT_182165 [Serpula lacrymans var. lacrymans S7.3]|uniref:protein disulfide-isomerase n=2 Tax=Serpula lacrymans var. lacrymans TaxID=341189 RepID=F8PWS9_SERL3|nr:uncharacterized protein SERLADRAFT_468685 [Serpula lacrymans var. lacrymans S7.9]EGN99256.1 hypothetical protein SERLA73DRAFT_182165 [Serpula lacrymans var. lacrymans S7.3]EGO24821.1 hypothetical protein SERLADRAFT_468685 [Serpula lacrymans var. lacrymans S7.9]
MKFSFSLIAAALFAGASASNVIDLVPDNFDSVIGQGKPGLVEFFAPWCGHCKNLAPIYEQLADAYAHAKDKVVIAKVDADGAGRDLGQKYGVKGYPTLKWFDGKGNVEPYENARDLDALSAFVSQKAGVKSNIKPPPPPETLILDASTFDEVALDESKDVLVTFTAPWCGHCKSLKPIYELVAKDFKAEDNCVVANIDADAAENKPIASRYDVASYPTIKFFPKGGKAVESYEGGRTEQAFVTFLNERCGTQRAIGGGLSDEAGRFPELDSLAQKFLVATSSARDSIYKEALALSGSVGSTASQYTRVMEKIIDGSEEYITKESKRLASILSKRSLASTKLDEIKVKANILKAFVVEKFDEAEEKVFGKASAEL